MSHPYCSVRSYVAASDQDERHIPTADRERGARLDLRDADRLEQRLRRRNPGTLAPAERAAGRADSLVASRRPVELPVDQLLPELVAGLQHRPNFVLTAEPGAGKTTRVPPAVLSAGLFTGEILVSQPRRLAARLAAARVAAELGESVGERCGYQVRFDSKVGPNTRIRFVTEGLLTRRLRDDPTLHGVDLVVLDEFHERHIDTDLALALLRKLQLDQRPDLRIGVMSATLDPGPISEFLDASTWNSPGRTFEVAIEYQSQKADRPLQSGVSSAFRGLCEDGVDGSVLVFLPGAAEIRRCEQSCRGLADHHGFELLTLHGDLSAAEQDHAVKAGRKHKLILSTNVAETSITVANVAAVIDAGLVRRPAHDPWTGIPTLSLAKVSRASAIQRAGRAGRTRIGRCIRLYSEHDLARRPAFDTPELARLDLASVMLDIRAAGVATSVEMEWFEHPPQPAVTAAEAVLSRIGALHDDGTLSEIGRALLRVPLHPRLARVVVEARKRGIAGLGYEVASLLSERSIRRRATSARPASTDEVAAADVLVDVQALRAFEERGSSVAHSLNLDIGACKMVQRVKRQLSRGGRGSPASTEIDAQAEQTLGLCLLTGFADRLGRLRLSPNGAREIVFGSGGSAELAAESAVHDGPFALALAVEERRQGAHASKTFVRSAAQIEPEWILEMFDDEIQERRLVEFDPERERVNQAETLEFGGLIIDRTERKGASEEAVAALRAAAVAKGPAAFMRDPAKLDALLRRLAFVAEQSNAPTAIDHETLDRALAEACAGCTSFAEVRKSDLYDHLLATLPPKVRSSLEQDAPTQVTLPGGQRLTVHYEADRPPWIESRLQDFFGQARGPTVASGRVPLVLHLLAPNRRAVQVTTDLAGFWERHYPTQRKALMRRYPRHDWPDDPLTAQPSKPRPRQRRR